MQRWRTGTSMLRIVDDGETACPASAPERHRDGPNAHRRQTVGASEALAVRMAVQMSSSFAVSFSDCRLPSAECGHPVAMRLDDVSCVSRRLDRGDVVARSMCSFAMQRDRRMPVSRSSGCEARRCVLLSYRHPLARVVRSVSGSIASKRNAAIAPSRAASASCRRSWRAMPARRAESMGRSALSCPVIGSSCGSRAFRFCREASERDAHAPLGLRGRPAQRSDSSSGACLQMRWDARRRPSPLVSVMAVLRAQRFLRLGR